LDRRVGEVYQGAAGLREVVVVPRCTAHSVYVHVRVFGCVHLHHPVDVREVESSVQRSNGREGKEGRRRDRRRGAGVKGHRLSGIG
jgi:hypothetical protein